MNLLIVLVAGGLIWAIANGKISKNDNRKLAASALVLTGLFLLSRGQYLAATALSASGIALWPWEKRVSPSTSMQMSAAEARAILGLADDADGAAIEAAHRRLIRHAHPDSGGSEELARQINLARDTLLSLKQ